MWCVKEREELSSFQRFYWATEKKNEVTIYWNGMTEEEWGDKELDFTHNKYDMVLNFPVRQSCQLDKQTYNLGKSLQLKTYILKSSTL